MSNEKLEASILNAVKNRLIKMLNSERANFSEYLDNHGLNPWVCSWHIARDIGLSTVKVKYQLEKMAKAGKLHRKKHCGGAVGFSTLELEGTVWRDNRFFPV